MKRNRAFTLIELLVVISIIALLMAILMPALSRARKQARAVACRSVLNQWGKVFVMYTMDNEGNFATGSTAKMWTTFLRPYYKDQAILFCPTASEPGSPLGSPMPVGSKFRAWGVFDATYAMLGLEGLSGSYGMNGHASSPPAGGGPDPWGLDYSKSWRSPNVRGASDIPLFLDCIWLGALPDHQDQAPEYENPACYETTNMKAFCIDRHEGYINGLFMDSSVNRIGLKELWKLKWHRSFDTSAGPPDWPQWMRGLKDYD